MNSERQELKMISCKIICSLNTGVITLRLVGKYKTKIFVHTNPTILEICVRGNKHVSVFFIVKYIYTFWNQNEIFDVALDLLMLH